MAGTQHHPQGEESARPDPTGLLNALPGSFDESGPAADWSVPWADLMMVLFVLFAVLYIYDLAERDPDEAFLPALADPLQHAGVLGQAPFGAVRPSPQQIYEQSLRIVQTSDLDDVDVVLGADRSVRISVKGPMFFDLGSAELRPVTRGFLRQLARVLQGHDREVRIVGHTDSFPVSSERFPTNWELSAARATAVVRFLVDQGGLDPHRFTAVAHSMYRPSVPNTSLENKAMNRRVEIIVTAGPAASAEASDS